MLMGIGVFADTGQITLKRAYKTTSLGEISIINYLGIIFSAIFGFACLDGIVRSNACWEWR